MKKRLLLFVILFLAGKVPNAWSQEERPTPNYPEPKADCILIPIHGPGYDGSIYPGDYGVPSANPHIHWWTPSKLDVDRAEKDLPKYILDSCRSHHQKNPSKSLPEFVRFYTGVLGNGRKYVKITLMLIPHKKWKDEDYRRPMDFGVEESINVNFDVKTGEYFDFDKMDNESKFYD